MDNLGHFQDPDHLHEHDTHHEHVIVSKATLRVVLATLLIFTALTVGLAKGEEAVATLFNVDLPGWINVFVALSIATVKTAVVVLFFMQLKYDSPINAMVFIFTIMTVAFFLGFTMLDLGNRGTINPWTKGYIQEGGTGIRTRIADKVDEQTDFSVNTAQPITAIAAEAAALLPGHAAHAAHGHDDHEDLVHGSTPNMSRPVHGITLPGYADPARDDHGHEGEQEEAPADGH